MTDCLYAPAGFSLFAPTAEVLAGDINASCTGTLFFLTSAGANVVL